MDVWCIGDVHGNVEALRRLLLSIPDGAAIVQVGDMGVSQDLIANWEVVPGERYVMFCEGNHEHFPLIEEYNGPAMLTPDLIYMPRGTVVYLKDTDGSPKDIGFLGGGFSVDGKYRKPGKGYYFPDKELITKDDIAKFDNVDHLDLLVTHTPPRSVEIKLDRTTLLNFGFDLDWVDPCGVLVEKLWQRLGQPKLVCGHLHKRVRDGNCRILAELECVKVVI